MVFLTFKHEISQLRSSTCKKHTLPHWDFLPKFLSLHYYTNLEGVLGVQRSRQAQGTIICLFGPLFFSQNGMTFKKLQKLSKSMEKLLFFGIFSKFVQFWLENSSPNQLDELKWIILLLLTPKPSLEAE
jgi:hypothetical protein